MDQARWNASRDATGHSFNALNTPAQLASASEQTRYPLRAVLSRKFVNEEYLPAPPYGCQVVKFRTRFADGKDTSEMLWLMNENGE